MNCPILNLYIRGQRSPERSEGKTASFRMRMNNGRSVFCSRKPRASARGASFAKCSYCGWMICQFCAQLTIVVIAIAFGALVAWKPRKVIEMQIAIYRPFNWKIEPISMEKEIRNTRIMGLAVLVLGILSLCFILLR